MKIGALCCAGLRRRPGTRQSDRAPFR